MKPPDTSISRPLNWVEHAEVTLTPAKLALEALPTKIQFGAFGRDGSVLDDFRMRRGNGISPVDTERPRATDRMAGTYLYGGTLEFQYGAFLVESLARFWFILRYPRLPILWHVRAGRTEFAPWQREILAMLGVPESRCQFISHPVTVDRILLADPGCILERWLHPQMADALAIFPFADPPQAGIRVWLSRSHLRDGHGKVAGEAEIEAALAKAGWSILIPEKMTVWQKLAAMASAEEIAGFEGSAFHSLILAGNVQARISLYKRSIGPVPLMHSLIADAKQLRQTTLELPLRHVEGSGRNEVTIVEDPLAVARTIDPAAGQRRQGGTVPSPGMKTPRSRLAFVHVPKTAGTSFTAALRVGWPHARVVGSQEQLDAIPDDELASLDLIAGHFRAYRIEQRCPSQFELLTVLRDPFARLVSAYWFARHTIEVGQVGDAAMQHAAKTTFGEWVFSPFGRTQQHSHLYLLGLRPGDLPRRMSLDTLLVQAKAQLDRMLVGTTDHLSEFLGLVFRHHGHEATPVLGRAMVGEHRDDGDLELTSAQRNELMEALRPDYALYGYGRDLMMRALERDSWGAG